MGSFVDTYGLEISGTSTQTSTNAAVGNTVFFVLRMDFTEGVDPVRLYVNPQPGVPEPAVPDALLLNLNVDMIDHVGLTGPGAFSFDALRIGTSFGDVTPVPEPSSTVLAVVAIPWLRCRCRSRNTLKVLPRLLAPQVMTPAPWR
jgi:hypothetical protein